MFSFGVKNSSLRYVLALLTLVIAASADELLPKVLGVGFPVLLMAVLVFAGRRPRALPIFFALAAGGAEDALSGLPFMTSASFFLVLAALVMWMRLPHVVALFAYPIYQAWLGLWAGGLKEGICFRALLAIPVGILVYFLVLLAVSVVERKAGVDEAG